MSYDYLICAVARFLTGRVATPERRSMYCRSSAPELTPSMLSIKRGINVPIISMKAYLLTRESSTRNRPWPHNHR